jgi:hypothetical protein
MFNDARYAVRTTFDGIVLENVTIGNNEVHPITTLDKALKITKQFKRENNDLCEVLIIDTATSEIIYHYKGERSKEIGFSKHIICFDQINDHLAQRLTDEYYEGNFDL